MATALPVGTDRNSFLMRLAAGEIPGCTQVHRPGHNSATPVTKYALWEGGGAYNYLPSAQPVYISSTDASDIAGGAGARTVYVSGLDANYAEISENVSMAGQSGVLTANSYLRISEIRVRAVGSTGYNAGSVYAGLGVITAGVPATIYGVIKPGKGRNHAAVYTVPVNKEFLLLSFSVSPNSQKNLNVSIFAREYGYGFIEEENDHAYQEAIFHDIVVPDWFDEKTDIELRCAVDNTTAEVAGHFTGILVDKA